MYWRNDPLVAMSDDERAIIKGRYRGGGSLPPLTMSRRFPV